MPTVNNSVLQTHEAQLNDVAHNAKLMLECCNVRSVGYLATNQ